MITTFYKKYSSNYPALLSQKTMKHLLPFLLITSTSGLIVKNPVLNKYGVEMLWVDGRDRLDRPVTVDTLFDRCVCISMRLDPEVHGYDRYKYFEHEVTGLVITEYLVLTSYNPFRSLIHNHVFLTRFRIVTMLGRYIVNPINGAYGYYGQDFQVFRYPSCARQVAPPFEEKDLPIHSRHGVHSPVHDLMVIRMSRPISFVRPTPPRRFHFWDYQQGVWYPAYTGYLMYPFGVIKTQLAVMGDELKENDLSYASIAHIDDIHIFENRFLEKGNVTGKFNIIENCEGWIPREWGHFICIRNVNKYLGIASGGVLFGGFKLFGVGSFALSKNYDSVLVFTDVRHYTELVYATCTFADQGMEKPPNETSWWNYYVGDVAVHAETFLNWIFS